MQTWRGRGPVWTEEEVSALYRALAEGLTKKEAAERVGRSFWAVVAKTKSLGLSFEKQVRLVQGKFPEWTEADVKKLRLLLQQMPLRQLALQLGRTPRAIRAKASRLGIPLAGGLVTQEEAAKILGVFPSTVRKAMRQLDIRKRQMVRGGRYYVRWYGLDTDDIEALARHLLKNVHLQASAKRLKEVAAGNYTIEGLSARMQARRRKKVYVQL